ncbi:S1 RNA-binding domain-containing protein [bacterium]|nr:S1 RNA-binding domain-containing protein [bacterium]
MTANELNYLLNPPKIGEIVEGQVIGIGRSSIYVDLGIFGTGIIYGKEFLVMKDTLRNLKKGDKIFAKIISLDNEQGYIELSLREANQEITWEKLKRKAENSETLRVKIIGANKGGLLTKVEGIPAFLPVSQLSPQHYPRVEGAESIKILKKLQKLIGKELEVKIFDIDPAENKLILSEKAKDSKKIKEMLKKYKIGDIVEGEITGVVDFGAFIKFPLTQDKKNNDIFLEGLIHISELDWQLIEDPSKIVKVGDKVKAKIINIVDDRVFLSLKALKENPWEEIEKKYKKGQIVKGVVTKFNPFGVFVRIAPKIQGLVHISEFDPKVKIEDVLKIGKEYEFEIISINPKNYKISLRLKQ